ncbi:hypothetical protein Psta_3053 [Pirellula staleyi DSM 6068]|uniref:DUF2314 domain-containing protein n=1 Tax=Pirellula staleyi (strain ATCC 27377 / DSM 6068 / ICPB 4128) TaxID=530564 RepID=D2R9G7_PIRSD|nr:hypothetical protein [Pirellula staleyi]ADB17717.1 hypothetical protein Psta_3053 [Pirellula staleyi DSM 6068]
MTSRWQFDDPPNTASFTTSFVLDGAPILRVYHDYDGGWQLHGPPDNLATPDVARIVSLGSMIAHDPSLCELHDLPNGWLAFRKSTKDRWKRQKNNPFPAYAENGYYLEDAVWMTKHRDDVHPPSEERRDNLEVGTYVKLLFRFAAEDAQRRDKQTERMWVLITHIDEDGNYIGTLASDPYNSSTLTWGDTIQFHPLHVMEILEEDGA